MKGPGLRRAALLLGWLLLATAGAAGDGLLAGVEARWGAAARERVAAWEELMSAGRDWPEGVKLERVNRFFNRLRFVSDQEHFGRRDYWATPVEMLGSGGGDCEDFSVAKYFTLRQMGVAEARMRITYVRARELQQTHMVVAYYTSPEAEPLILDNLVEEIRPASRRPDLVPVYSFNGDGLWRAVERGAGRRVGDAESLGRWRDLLQRMQREYQRGGSPIE